MDMDLDGFPELFMTLRMQPAVGAEYTKSFVLMNE